MAAAAPPAPFAIPDVVTAAIPFFVALVAAEMIYVRLTGKGEYNAKDSAASLAMGLGNSLIGALFLGAVVAAHFAVYQFRIFNIPWAWWSMALCFFGEDLAYYWFHRVAHERRWFWASHVIHHSSQHYNLTTALRQTWTSAVSLSWIFWLPLSLIGFPPAMTLLFSGISLVYQFWIHTETIGRLGPLEAVFNTPSHHRVHHATNPRYLDANYAGVLIIWDKMFGTFVAERDDDKPRYGIIANLGSFNPLRIAFHEWVGIWRDATHAKSPGDVLGYVFGPPGWSPDGSRKTSASLKAAWTAQQVQGIPAE
jgi:sterol desaturase/sphingolipid hydroxylase (fatty acid hydroxylase superfamily)